MRRSQRSASLVSLRWAHLVRCGRRRTLGTPSAPVCRSSAPTGSLLDVRPAPGGTPLGDGAGAARGSTLAKGGAHPPDPSGGAARRRGVLPDRRRGGERGGAVGTQ